MEQITAATQITGKHHSKINALQTPSDATLEYAKTLTMHAFGPGEVAEREWEAAGLRKPDLDIMVICVESYIGRKAGGPGIKLEDQILITETGHERLTSYPWEDVLLA